MGRMVLILLCLVAGSDALCDNELVDFSFRWPTTLVVNDNFAGRNATAEANGLERQIRLQRAGSLGGRSIDIGARPVVERHQGRSPCMHAWKPVWPLCAHVCACVLTECVLALSESVALLKLSHPICAPCLVVQSSPSQTVP